MCRVRMPQFCSMRYCPAWKRFRRRSSPWLKSDMAQLADVLVPPNEEGTRATVLKWGKRVGDAVTKDEPLVELETDKATVEIPAPASGILIEIIKQANAEGIPAEVIARLSLGDAALGDAVSAPPEAESPAGA